MRLVTIGRSTESTVYVENTTVSRRHAELLVTSSGALYLTDCNSSSGTFLLVSSGWTSIRQGFVAKHDTIRMGDVEATIEQLLSLS